MDTKYSRTNPFPGKVVVNRRLTGEGSAKDTRHFEISLAGSGLTYEVGDSMTVWATNCPELVDDLLRVLHFSGDEIVPNPKGDQKLPVREALFREYAISRPTPKFLKGIAERAEAAPLLKDLLAPERKADLDTYLWGLEIIDFLFEHPSIKFSPEEFVGLLAKLQPRLYSISSSLKAHPESVHFTIDVVRYETKGRVRKGVCSTFLADRAADGTPVPVFPNASKFRLPADPGTPIIMCGPGTGVAPFRAFLQDRQATGAKGRNWLFFGSQKAATDFFYREEFEKYQNDGILTRLDTAFSRDQEQKIYVQDRMKEGAKEFWAWLNEGACFYVCGDAKRMAKDVDAMLHQIIQEQGGKSEDQAREYVEAMKKDGRYKRDVY